MNDLGTSVPSYVSSLEVVNTVNEQLPQVVKARLSNLPPAIEILRSTFTIDRLRSHHHGAPATLRWIFVREYYFRLLTNRSALDETHKIIISIS